jgi:DNA replication protein
MQVFKGFSSKTKNNIQIPSEFFSEILPGLDEPDEMKAVLFVFWYLQIRDENTGYVTITELMAEPVVSSVFALDGEKPEQRLKDAFKKAVNDGILLCGTKGGETYFFINTPRGKAMQKGLVSGEWQPADSNLPVIPITENRPNIFTLYEQNIGMLTPIVADILVDAEKIYPTGWIEEAMKIAVERNARNWRFIEAILRSWKEKGRDEKDQRTTTESRKRDSEGEFGEFIRH